MSDEAKQVDTDTAGNILAKIMTVADEILSTLSRTRACVECLGPSTATEKVPEAQDHISRLRYLRSTLGDCKELAGDIERLLA